MSLASAASQVRHRVSSAGAAPRGRTGGTPVEARLFFMGCAARAVTYVWRVGGRKKNMRSKHFMRQGFARRGTPAFFRQISGRRKQWKYGQCHPPACGKPQAIPDFLLGSHRHGKPGSQAIARMENRA